MGSANMSFVRENMHETTIEVVEVTERPTRSLPKVVASAALGLLLVLGIVAIVHANQSSSTSSSTGPSPKLTYLATDPNSGLPPVTVAVISGFTGYEWGGACATTSDDTAPATYSGGVYGNCSMQNIAAIKDGIVTAAETGADMIVLMEGYAFNSYPTPTNLEPLMAIKGQSMCTEEVKANAPAQYMMSCTAAENKIAVSGNVFVSLPEGYCQEPYCYSDTCHDDQEGTLAAGTLRGTGKGTCNNRIMEIVYDNTGVVVALYAKYHLFPTDLDFAVTGGWNPTVFEMFGHKFGILICYDGLWPYVFHNFSEFDALKAMGADTFVWSIGADLPIDFFSKKTARKMEVNMVASESVSGTRTGGVANSADIILYNGQPPAGLVKTEFDVEGIAPYMYQSDLQVFTATLP